MGVSKKISCLAALSACLTLPLSAGIDVKPHFKVLGMVVVWAADVGSNVPVVSDFVIDTGNGTTAATSGDADLIADNVHTVVTGSLIATQDALNSVGTMPFVITNTTSGNVQTDSNGDGILDASDSFSGFGLLGTSDTRVDATTTHTSFYVASNTAFAIDVETFAPGTLLDFILLAITRLDMSVTRTGDDGLAFGSAAQFPHSGGPTGGMQSNVRLLDLIGGDNFFTGNQRTAATRGTLAGQSVRFDADYSISATNLQGYDLSLGTFDFEVDVVYTVFVP